MITENAYLQKMHKQDIHTSLKTYALT